jgi:hypothetical protein
MGAFDCEKDPLELFNFYYNLEYADIVKSLTADLENLMEEIGDEPVHQRTKGY